MRYAWVVLVAVLACGILTTGVGCSEEKDEEAYAQPPEKKGLFERAGAATDSVVKKTVDVTGKAVDKSRDAAGAVYDKTKDVTGKAVNKTREVTGEGLKKAGEFIKPDEKKEE